jgi:hypothetical protein
MLKKLNLVTKYVYATALYQYKRIPQIFFSKQYYSDLLPSCFLFIQQA